MLVWDVSAILEIAGGVARLRRALAQAGQEVPDRAAVQMWRSRSRLPTNWSAPIVFVITRDRPGLDVRQLMKDVPIAGTDANAETGDDDDLFGDAA